MAAQQRRILLRKIVRAAVDRFVPFGHSAAPLKLALCAKRRCRVEIGLWLLVAVLAVALAYTTQFITATLTMGRELAGSTTKRGFQDAITPPWQTNLALVVYVGIPIVALVMWWRIGWPSALAGMVAIFVGSLVAGFIVPQASGGHYQRLILQSMIARYANYLRDGDVLRAEAMKQLLTRAGIDPDPCGAHNLSLQHCSPPPLTEALTISELLFSCRKPKPVFPL